MGFGAGTLDNLSPEAYKVAEYAAKLSNELGVSEIVVGFPKNMNGTVGERGEKTKMFVEKLEELVDVPVILWDERLTTVSAHNLMNVTNVRGKKRKESVDSISRRLYITIVSGQQTLRKEQ